ncbi:MAG: hypothetical protein WCK52_08100 [Betaproteobacteria bacterium]|jgi:hypothetical protein
MIKNQKAIVAFALGEKYQKMFNDLCRLDWEKYCKKYNYDFYLITEPLDDSSRAQARSPSWQKLLILSQPWSSSYEQVVWLDTDILINAEQAQDISEGLDLQKVAAVNAFDIPDKRIHQIISKRPGNSLWSNHWATPQDYYSMNGFSNVFYPQVVHGGVFVCSPAFHKSIFEHVYYDYEDDPEKMQAEQPALSYELLKNNLIEWLPSEFNYCVSPLVSAYYPFLLDEKTSTTELRSLALTNLYSLGNFLHFAGCHQLMSLVKRTS